MEYKWNGNTVLSSNTWIMMTDCRQFWSETILTCFVTWFCMTCHLSFNIWWWLAMAVALYIHPGKISSANSRHVCILSLVWVTMWLVNFSMSLPHLVKLSWRLLMFLLKLHSNAVNSTSETLNWLKFACEVLQWNIFVGFIWMVMMSWQVIDVIWWYAHQQSISQMLQCCSDLQW